jgi:tetratricopeptide (TPR) repeat protein
MNPFEVNLTDSAQLYRNLELARSEKDKMGEALTLQFLARYSLNVGDWEEGDRYLAEALDIAQSLKSPKLLGECYNIQGGIFKQRNRYKKAIEAWETSVNYYFQTDDHAGGICVGINLTTAFITMGELNNAESILDVLLKKACEIKEGSLIAEIANHFGVLYTHMGNYPKAHDYFEKAKFTFDALKITNIGNYYQNLGDLYLQENRLAEAEAAYQAALALETERHNIYAQCLLLCAIAPIYITTCRHKEATKVLEKGLILVEGLDNPYFHAHLLFYMGVNEYTQNHINEAIPILQETIVYYRKVGATQDVQKVHQFLSKIISQKNH